MQRRRLEDITPSSMEIPEGLSTQLFFVLDILFPELCAIGSAVSPCNKNLDCGINGPNRVGLDDIFGAWSIVKRLDCSLRRGQISLFWALIEHAVYYIQF